MSVPNQKVVQIAPRKKRNKENLYAMLNLDALQSAMVELNGSSLKLWLYFNKNQENYHMELSQRECLKWGIKKDSYYSAVKDLGAKGYLLPVRDGSNIYNFYEDPRPSEIPKPQKKRDSDSPKRPSEKPKPAPEIQKELSENLERNNTDITGIVQNNTIVDFESLVLPKPKEEKRVVVPATQEEIYMYGKLDHFICFCSEGYNEEEMEKLGEFLLSECYWDIPAERIEQMTAEERRQMKVYYKKYCC